MAAKQKCCGRSAQGAHLDLVTCPAPPMYSVHASRSSTDKQACGRHISWLLRYVTVPGRTVTVTRLAS